jgi:hypothetical protein
MSNGPKVIPVPAVVPSGRGVSLSDWRRRRGFGGLSLEYCNSGWSLLNPVAWFGGCAANDLANVYEKVQYGTPPAVVTPPAPSIDLAVSPSTPGAIFVGNDKTGSPVYAAPQTAAESQQAIIDKQNAAIDAAIASGQWNPAGNLPVNALDLSNFWAKYGTALLIGGAVVGGLVVVNAVRR